MVMAEVVVRLRLSIGAVVTDLTLAVPIVPNTRAVRRPLRSCSSFPCSGFCGNTSGESRRHGPVAVPVVVSGRIDSPSRGRHIEVGLRSCGRLLDRGTGRRAQRCTAMAEGYVFDVGCESRAGTSRAEDHQNEQEPTKQTKRPRRRRTIERSRNTTLFRFTAPPSDSQTVPVHCTNPRTGCASRNEAIPARTTRFSGQTRSVVAVGCSPCDRSATQRSDSYDHDPNES